MLVLASRGGYDLLFLVMLVLLILGLGVLVWFKCRGPRLLNAERIEGHKEQDFDEILQRLAVYRDEYKALTAEARRRDSAP